MFHLSSWKAFISPYTLFDTNLAILADEQEYYGMLTFNVIDALVKTVH